MKKNKILITILIISIILAIIIIAFVMKNKDVETEKDNKINEKIYNTKDTIKEEYRIDNMLFDKVTYYYYDPETYITFNATNTGEETITFGYFTITIKDEEGNTIFQMLTNLDTPLASGETKEMQLSTLGNFVEGYTLEFEKFEEVFLED